MIEKLKVLVLNNTYEPLHFCAARRAVSMLMCGRAVQVESDGIMLHSFSRSFPCPTVIRLNRYIRLPRYSGVSFSKKNVLKRDNKTCQYCGETEIEMTMDHIIPRSAGGSSDWLNVVTACRICNHTKGNRSPEEAGMKLMREPYRPRFMALLSQPNSMPEGFLRAWDKHISAYFKQYPPVKKS